MKKLIQALFALAIGWAATASAADYPDHPIRLIVPFSGGTSTDLVGRVLGEAMSRKLGQPVIVENRPGVGGSIGTDYVAKSKKDGFDLTAWFMLAAPAGVDDAVKQKLIGTLAEVLQETKVKEQLLALGLEGTGSLASAQLQGFVDAEIAKWSAVVKTAGARVD